MISAHKNQMVFGLLSFLAILATSSQTPSRTEKCFRRHSKSSLSADSSDEIYNTSFPGVTWDEDNWLLSTTKLDQGHYQARGSVANGYLGINVAAVGPFFEIDVDEQGGVINGWPLFSRRQTFATIAGFFDAQPITNGTNFPWLLQYGYESVISGVPHWSGLILDLGDDTYLDATVDNKSISNFTSTYDFKAGVLEWSYKWTPKGKDGSYDINYRLFANKLHVNQAVVDLTIIPSIEWQGTIVNVIDGYSAVRTDFVKSGQDEDGAIFSAVRPIGIANVTAYIYAQVTGSKSLDLSKRKLVQGKPYVHTNDSSVAQAIPVKFSAGKAVHITKYVGAASSDAFDDPKKTAKEASRKALENGYEKSLQSHITEWASVMPDDSVDSYAFPDNGTLPDDEYIIDSAIIAVTNTYYLLQNTVGKNAIKAVSGAPVNVDSISVGGLTSDSYAGMIFWDADLFMQPGLTTSHPEAAQRITNYRVAKYEQAKANIATSFTGSQNDTDFSASAAVYPWTSGRFGNCTATGPCWDYEYHLNGDIGISMVNQWVTTGDTDYFKETLLPIYDSVATLFSDLLKPNGSSWTITNMTDPDEYANHIDAGGFTMALASETLIQANQFREEFGLSEYKTWENKASDVLLIRENGVTLEYTTMNGSVVVKQADVVLIAFPLGYNDNYTDQDGLNDLDYYANKQSPDGPAMTWAIYSIVADELSPSGCSAYTYAQYSYKPYTRAPFYQLSEQLIDNATTNGGTHPAYPFLTGHGGANQVTIFGYLGLRLLPDDGIHVMPNLPPQLSYLKYRTFYWRGWPISAWSNYTHTTIQRHPTTEPLDVADRRYTNRSITVYAGSHEDPALHHLSFDKPVVIRNRQIGTNNTIAGNLAQCRPVKSSNSYEPGQFPMAVVDGATSTKWQPSKAAEVNYVTVSLAEEKLGTMVTGFYFNWAEAPPVNVTVIFHNETLDDPVRALTEPSDYDVVLSKNIIQSDPYDVKTADLNTIVMPTGNSTKVNLKNHVPLARYASLFIVGNQALSAAEVRAKNGTGATVAEWAILH
ncbi:glycosyl hydrolase family 65 central catalytic domain-containing protein [Fusarium flagelliforme]|uniref:glycosyl hydrolase family 65 central catalytic domain-containing protein n=1 Tax=Fusarium flagelliforme TaxID=2675880 RepID=UPI001E8DA4B7|nr:glycosyl hydrolase family 65 central catalytic domain-containing protein [Fusarium flagelliforme]KAH7186247.1 glycosyl hydrolase family 65 central catalytic domain-containing protein [Fusarium flagelliforme]